MTPYDIDTILAMTPHDIDTILMRLDGIDGKLDGHTDRLDAIDEKVAATNGRLRGVELWRARVEGAMSVGSSPIIAAVLSGVLVAVILTALKLT